MKAKSRQKLIFAALPLTVVWAVFNLPSEEQQPEISQPIARISQETPTLASPPLGAGLINVEDRAMQSWGADPFRTDRYESGAPGTAPLPREWTLKGIVYTETNPLAFINRKSVRVGDVVNEAEVMAINKKSVILKFEDQEITLAVKKG
ncbi:MAG: hypothetical protein GY867_03575 [bacterium]|nr:hypothetical protein [bacterium]